MECQCPELLDGWQGAPKAATTARSPTDCSLGVNFFLLYSETIVTVAEPVHGSVFSTMFHRLSPKMPFSVAFLFLKAAMNQDVRSNKEFCNSHDRFAEWSVIGVEMATLSLNRASNGQPVKLVDIDRIARAYLQQELVGFDLDGEGTGCLFLVDELAAGLGQGVELEFQVLVAGRDAGEADFHEAEFTKLIS